MSTKTINISLPHDLLEKIDEAAKGEYASRSDFIRESIVRRLKGQRVVDEWDDPAGEWEEGVDLRDNKGRGIPVDTFLTILKRVEAEQRHEHQNRKIS